MKYIKCDKLANSILDKINRLNKPEIRYSSDRILAIIKVGEDPASDIYVRGKVKDAAKAGIHTVVISVSNEWRIGVKERVKMITDLIYILNKTDDVQGIILQLPLPAEFKGYEEEIINHIVKSKDVDGLRGDSKYLPATPRGVMNILEDQCVRIYGKNVLIIGRSKLVGLPMFDILEKKNATCTLAHSHTPKEKLDHYIENADIIISAVGKPIVDLTKCKNAEIVIDVGMHFEDGKLCGDAYNFNEELYPDLLVTKTPGGTGLMTRAALMENVIEGPYSEYAKECN